MRDDDDLDPDVRQRVEELADEIQSCEYCQENQDPDMGFVLGDSMEIQELLTQAGVDEDELASYLPLISCPNCGVGGMDFSLNDEVGMPTSEELLHRDRWREWTRELRPRVTEFAAHLETYPYLGGAHDLGKEILDTLPKFSRVTLPASRWWRARQAHGARVFTLDDLQPPPPRQAAAEGRFNHYGQAVFYLGATQRAALRETIDIHGVDRVAWLQEFSIGPIENVLDLRVKDWSEELKPPLIAVGLTSEYISATASTTAWKPEYLVPRFIADGARYAGYRGIIFNSTKHTDENIVLFTWDDLAIAPTGNPTLRVVERDEEDDRWENPDY
jgi:hypothetical protein